MAESRKWQRPGAPGLRADIVAEPSVWPGDDRKRRPTSSTLGDYFYFGCMAVAILGVLIYSTHPMVVFALMFAGSIATLFIHDLGVLFLDSGIGRWIIITPLFGMGVCYLLGYRLW